MFDTLEADIVVFQETKIQRKDLRDDMVLVPGWDCYFSLPKHKKGMPVTVHIVELSSNLPRLLWRCNLYPAERLLSNPRGRRHHGRSLPAKFND